MAGYKINVGDIVTWGMQNRGVVAGISGSEVTVISVTPGLAPEEAVDRVDIERVGVESGDPDVREMTAAAAARIVTAVDREVPGDVASVMVARISDNRDRLEDLTLQMYDDGADPAATILGSASQFVDSGDYPFTSRDLGILHVPWRPADIDSAEELREALEAFGFDTYDAGYDSGWSAHRNNVSVTYNVGRPNEIEVTDETARTVTFEQPGHVVEYACRESTETKLEN